MDRRLLEDYAERASHRGHRPSRIGALRAPAIASKDGQGPAGPLAGEGSSGHEAQPGDPRRNEAQQVVQPRGALAEVLELSAAEPEHRVGGVDHAIDRRPYEPAGEEEAHRRHERVGQVLGDGLDGRRGDLALVERGGRPAHEVVPDGPTRRGQAAPASPATPIATTAPPARSRAGEPWQSHRCPAPRSRPIQVTGWYRFGGSPKTRSIASASTSTNSLEISGFRTTGTRSRYLSTESHAQPRANGKVGAGRSPRDLGGHVEDNSRENEELDAGIEPDDVAGSALRRRGVEVLAVHRPPGTDLAVERGGHCLLEQEGGPLRLAQPGQSHVRIEAQLPRQIEGRERRAPEIDPLRADRRARRRQLDERQDAERGPPAAFRRVEKPILDGECEIAEADVGVGVLQPDQRVHVEPGLEPARDSRSQEDVDQELLLVLTVAQSGPRVLDPALDLQSAGRNRDRAGGETRAVGRDEILLGH